MYYILRVGCQWRDLPTQFGPWNSVYTRFRRWCRSGLWARLLAAVADEAAGEIRCLDCSHVKVHQDGSNAADGRDRQAIGQTKGGLNTKIAAVVDGLGRAVAVCLAPGQRNDQKAVAPLLDGLRGAWAVADRGFDSATFRHELTQRHARPCIPPRRTSRIVYFYLERLYQHRHVVENFFGRIKRFRRIGTRYEKLAETFLGFVTFAAVVDWIRFEV